MSRAKHWIKAHPIVVNWAVLALGMVVIFWIAAYDKGLTGGQMAALTAACVALAGLCAWIVAWE